MKVIGIILFVIFLIILFYFLTYKTKTNFSKSKSAEYPTIAENISRDPNIVEVSLTASDNEIQILDEENTKLYNYNKSFPGPLIEGKVGDTLIVNFFNDLVEPTSILWHGLTSSAFDNSENGPVPPGSSYIYKFKLNRAGLFSYRSNTNSREQTSMGLFGVVLVKDYKEDALYKMPANERVLAFSDLNLDTANQVDIEFSSIPEEKLYQQVNGILGNVILTNGVYDGHISLCKNVPVRLYLVNCATDRFMKISLEGHDMLRVGGDQGVLERPILIKEENGLVLTCGERAEIVFVPRRGSVRLFTESNVRGIQNLAQDEAGNFELNEKIESESEKLVLVTFVMDSGNAGDAEEDLQIPLHLKKVKKIKVDHCTPVISINYENIGDIKIMKDMTYILEIKNDSLLPNNFYLHGCTFQHIDTIFNGKRVENKLLEDKDTIYVPTQSVVRLAATFKSNTIFSSRILTRSEQGDQGLIQIVADIKDVNMTSYSSFFKGDHSACLTKAGKYVKDDLSNTLDDLTKSLILCKCGSRKSACSCV